ncbi:MAG: hypothetical protein RLZZ299_2736 [Pseudomonadota bacterium]|jgi:hypothetical protein
MLVALLSLVPYAFPCAGFVTEDATVYTAASDAQQAVIVREDPTHASVVFQARYAGNAEDFAWIIPIPGPVTSVEEGDPALFTTLAEVSEPTVRARVVAEEDASSGGCALLASSGDANAPARASDDLGGAGDGVEVVAEGFAGAFAYEVLEATDPNAMFVWLNAEGYDSSVSATSITMYMQDPDVTYRWVAVQLTPDAAQAGQVVDLKPLRIQWTADENAPLVVRYPHRMARTSRVEEIRTTLYVAGMGTPLLDGGWTVAGQGRRDDDPALTSDTIGVGATTVFESALRGIGIGRKGYWNTWGGTPAESGATVDGLSDADAAIVSGFVARYDGIHAPVAHTADMELGVGEPHALATIIQVSIAEDRVSADAAWIVPLGMLGFAAGRRSRRGRRA